VVTDWQEAFLEQLLTTSLVERLYRASNGDTSYEAVFRLIEIELGYEAIQLTNDNDVWVNGADAAVSVDGTTLYFADGEYAGSKAALPESLVFWRAEDDEL